MDIRSSSFQRAFAAVFLPRSQSLCFYKSSYETLEKHYVVWLARDTAQSLCKRDLASIDGHYRFDDDVSLWRIHAPPSQRLELPYVSYWRGELRFTNGRHRTRTLIDFGADYVPFDIEEASLKEMAQDGIKLDAFEKVTDFAPRLEDQLDYNGFRFDPIVKEYKKAFPRRMKMDDVIKTSRLHLRLLDLDVRSMTQYENVLVALDRPQALNRHEDEAHIHNEIRWYRDALRVALPAFVSLKRQGVTEWPKQSCFPIYSGNFREMKPEDAVREWAQKLPVPVKLGKPAKDIRLG